VSATSNGFGMISFIIAILGFIVLALRRQ
jgi:hypothetical protein